MAQYFPLKLQPGVYKQGTDYQARGRWLDADCIRWSMGATAPIGGWLLWGDTTDPDANRLPEADGIPRTTITWADNTQNRWLAVGTYKALYVYDESAQSYDITPTALVPGQEDADPNTGYGDWKYGFASYGTPRPDLGAGMAATTWSLATFGEKLTGTTNYNPGTPTTPGDGRLWEWTTDSPGTPGSPTLATLIAAKGGTTNIPSLATSTLVTPQRIQMVFGGTVLATLGTQNRRAVFWSDIEDNTNWEPTATNFSGEQLLETTGDLIGGVVIKDQILIFTTTDVWLATYVGLPYVYGFNQLAVDCGPISLNSVVVANNRAYWMGGEKSGFFMFDGSVKNVPCDVEDFLHTNITEAQGSKVVAWHNNANTEIFWFYPKNDTEVSAYVSYNYEEGHWAVGSLARSGANPAGIFARPICFDTSGYVYEQEIGGVYQDEGDSAIVPYAQSGPIELGDGDRLVSATKYIPDITSTGDGTLTFSYQMYPTSTASTTSSITLSEPTSIRFQGRQFTMKVTSASAASWNLGVPRIQMQATSRR